MNHNIIIIDLIFLYIYIEVKLFIKRVGDATQVDKKHIRKYT
jgi:hypothetical protein